jgi:hypothetical protein
MHVCTLLLFVFGSAAASYQPTGSSWVFVTLSDGHCWTAEQLHNAVPTSSIHCLSG